MSFLAKNVEKLGRFLAFCEEIQSGNSDPGHGEIVMEVELISDLISISTSWGIGDEKVASASKAYRKGSRLMATYNKFHVLAPEMFKRNTITDVMALKEAVSLEKDELLTGGAAEALRLEDLLSSLITSDPVQSSALAMMTRGRRALLDDLSHEDAVLANLSPSNDIYGEFDGGRRDGGLSVVLATDVLSGVSDHKVVPVGTTAYSKRIDEKSHEVVMSSNPVSVIFGEAQEDCFLTVSIAIENFGRCRDTADTNRRYLATDAELLGYMDGLVFSDTLSVKKHYSKTYSAGPGALGLYTIHAAKGSFPLVLFDATGGVGGTDMVSARVTVVSSRSNGYGSGGLRNLIPDACELEAKIGDIPVFTLEKINFNKVDRHLTILGAYDDYLRKKKIPHATGRDMRSVLSEYAEACFGVTKDYFKDKPVWSIEYWLAARPNTIDQEDWSSIYDQFYRLLPVYKSSLLSSDRFITEWADSQVGINL